MNNKIKKHLILIIVSMMLVSISSTELFAQRRSMDRRKNGRSRVVKNLPHGHKTLYVGKSKYHYSHGRFYRPSQLGYSVVKAPIGARLYKLPTGFVKLRLGPITYYHHLGSYYKYDRARKVFIVVEKPRKRVNDQNSEYDRLVLVDGETLYGRYLGGNHSTIEFEAHGEIYEYPIEEVKYLKFAEI
jgi:hypothetical protein